MSEHAHSARPVRSSRTGALRTALLVLLAYAVLGVVAGVAWEWLWTPPGQVIVRHQVLFDSYASLRRVFTGTGLYVVVGAVTSALVAVVVAALTRGRELLVLAVVVVGSVIAAALMWRVGTMLGPADPATVAAHTTGRATVQGDLRVAGRTPYLIWPMTSLFVLAVVFFSWPSSTSNRAGAASPPDPREVEIPDPHRR
jgi:hypothetical protein